MADHAVYAPSASDRWIACLRAVPLEAKAPPEVSSQAARDGTDAHELASLMLGDGVGLLGDGVGLAAKYDKLINRSPEHVEAAEQYADHIRAVHAKIGGDLYVEQKVTIYEDKCWGTADAIIVTPQLLFVSDFKSGSGYIVPVETWQLRAYAIGVVKFCQSKGIAVPTKIHLEIFQPRARDIEPVRFVEYDIMDLMQFELTIRDAIDRSLAGDGKFEVGAHCRWCRAKADCPAMAAAAVDLAHLRMHDGNPEAALDPQAMGPEQLDQALKLATVLEPWIKAVWARASSYLEMGGSLDSAKLVTKKRTRKWKDEDAVPGVLKTFGINPYGEPKLLTPAQADKLVDNPELADHYTFESPGLTITTSDDKRPAANNPEALKNAAALLKAQTG